MCLYLYASGHVYVCMCFVFFIFQTVGYSAWYGVCGFLARKSDFSKFVAKMYISMEFKFQMLALQKNSKIPEINPNSHRCKTTSFYPKVQNQAQLKNWLLFNALYVVVVNSAAGCCYYTHESLLEKRENRMHARRRLKIHSLKISDGLTC